MTENLEGAMLYSIDKGDIYNDFSEYEEDMQSFRFSDIFGKKDRNAGQ